ncbi:MAG: type VI secretion system tip protein TssI/VgrG [Acetobacteraceae bacterium]
MSDSDAKPNVDVTIKPDPGFTLNFTALRASEELGRPFLFELDVASDTVKGDLTSLLGSSATVTISVDDTTKRHFNGIIACASYEGLAAGAHRYRLELRPWIWLLSRIRTSRIFQNQSVWDVITTVFRDAGFTKFEDKRQNGTGDIKLEYCVQYEQTSLDFVTRLMETYGLYYFFTHSDDQHVLVMADDPNSHKALGKAVPFNSDETEYRRIDDHIWQWSSALHLQSGGVTLNDYNFTTPSADLTAKSLDAGSHSYGSYEMFDYPGPHGTTGDGQKLAAVRMQDISARRQVLSGTSNCRGLHAGGKFTLSDFTDEAQNREYLLTRATCTVEFAEGQSDDRGELTDTFRCVFAAMKGDIPFRLDRRTPRPVMRGPQTAKVTGAPGDEITSDQYGRIKVKFFWDRSAVQDDNSSCWIRVAQIWAGANWGGMFIPRVGQEVVVEFLDGDPDRPIITGCVYNANQGVPYPLPDNKTRSGIKTHSSTGSGNNELRFEDKAGSEEIFLQAQKDYNKVVLNNETVKITQDTTTTVEKGNRSVTVSQGNDGLTVSTGDHTITVSAGNSTIKAGQSILLQVGGNSVRIDTDGITLVGSKVSIMAQESMSVDGGLSMTLQAAQIAIN